MGAPIIGRTDCPECGFTGAHVKQSEKCVFRYCPECGSQHHCRTERQRADLMAKMRPADAPAPTPATPTRTPTPAATDAPAAPAVDTPPTPTEPTATPAPRRKPSLW